MTEAQETRESTGIRSRIGSYLHPRPNYDIDQVTDDELRSVARRSSARFVGWFAGGTTGVIGGAITFFDGLDVQDRSAEQMAVGVGVMAMTGIVSFVRMARNLAADFDAGVELRKRHSAETDQEAETARVRALERQLAPLVMATEVNPALIGVVG